MKYDHQSIDKKWQDAWDEARAFCAKDPREDDSQKGPFYCLVEFPYPSGAGLHMGHPRSYTALDVVARKRRMEGYNVLYPMGWDAFGLPAENYAIKTGRPPQEVTAENIATFKAQLKGLGLSFDWEREVNTTDPGYYKWTQWMFLEFFKGGLAYKAGMPINWCVDCKIGLANEEVVNGVCERCGGPVEKRDKEQWMIAITKYADRLLSDLDTVDYLPKIKKQQQDWIGRSEGAEITFTLEGRDASLTVFTTRPDTLFGATYMVLAPEHGLVEELADQITNIADVRAYREAAAAKSDIERGDDTKEKTGVALEGVNAVHPVTGASIPVWVADYVMMGYGTGAIMAVPAHDERDFAFAKKFDLEIVPVVSGGDASEAYTGDGEIVNSDFLNGMSVEEAKTAMIAWLEKEGKGTKKVNYKLRDWVFSRQRYWGEPIPLVKCAGDCGKDTDGWVAVPEDQLPVELPTVETYVPTDNGESPLAAITGWVNTACPECGGPATRETDTMPNWAGSSWYYLRYTDAKNDQAFASKEALEYWMPVDWYNGGMEHTTLHLLYSRFWNKFLHDRGHVPCAEPYQKRTSHGLILAEDGTKMSKSKGNGVNPDDVREQYGADALRLYQMFVGPFGEAVPWMKDGVKGMDRFLRRLYRYVLAWLAADQTKSTDNLPQPLYRFERLASIERAIMKVSEDIESMKFNTAVAALNSVMLDLLSKSLSRDETINEIAVYPEREQLESFIKVVSVFAPHLGEELWEMMGNEGLVSLADWPEHDPELVKESSVTLGVQVNGKVRGQVTLAVDASEDAAREAALEIESVASHLEGKEIRKFIYIPGKIVSIVV